MSDNPQRKRGIVCCFCGESWGYEGDDPAPELIKAAIDHEAICEANPYLTKIEELKRERDDYKNHFEACEAQRQEVAKERDELRAEVERLTEDRNCEKRMRQDTEEARENLAAEVERLKADSERLDWLNETKCHLIWSDRAQGFYVQRNGQVCGNISGAHSKCREAIDAAMKGDT